MSHRVSLITSLDTLAPWPCFGLNLAFSVEAIKAAEHCTTCMSDKDSKFGLFVFCSKILSSYTQKQFGDQKQNPVSRTGISSLSWAAWVETSAENRSNFTPMLS